MCQYHQNGSCICLCVNIIIMVHVSAYVLISFNYEHFPDKVNACELPFMYQEVWSATFCQSPSQQKRQRRRVSSLCIGFQRDAHLFLFFYLFVLKFRMTCSATVSISAFLACHQCYCAGSNLARGLNLRAVVCGIF